MPSPASLHGARHTQGFDEVICLAAALSKLGVKKGSNVAKYDAFFKVADYLVDKIFLETAQNSKLYYKEKRIVNESVYTRQFYTMLFGLGKCNSKKICETTKLDFEKSAKSSGFSFFSCGAGAGRFFFLC